ncbi:F-box/LRR-repeat protein [Spatholobus suberectus]|nr:F-box/LRR-repeat protein [Spatholobus suberectus]
MENSNSASRTDWNDLSYEILVRIFMSLNVEDLAVASVVCKSWNRACRDPSLWRKLDLSQLSSYCFNIHNKRRAWDDKHSSPKMTQFLFLKYVLSLSNGNTSCLVFDHYVYLRDEQFITAADR